MNKIFIILALLFIFQSCQNINKGVSFELDGTIHGIAPKYIYLMYGKIKDSSIVINNQFQFKGTIKNPIEASFVIPPASAMLDDWIYLENGKIKIEINIEKRNINEIEVSIINIDTIIGSRTEIIKREFNDFEKLHRNKIDWNAQLFNKLDDLISSNSNNSYSGHLLAKYCKDSILSNTQKKQLFRKIDTLSLSNQNIENIKRLIYPELSMKEGNQMFDFTLPDVSGKLINTISFREKTILIDFWASWCGPCRKINPELLGIYKDYKHRGFEILGISLDKNKEKWIQAIQDDGLIWKNLIDTNEFKGIAASKYNINSIPSNFLVDTNGKIVAVNISIKKLKEYLSNNL